MTTVQGVGLGLRWDFLDELIERTQASEVVGGPALPIDFLEVPPENYMGRGGRYPAALSWLAERYPLVTHGLSMSVGGTAPLDTEYLSNLSAAVCAWQSPWHSDHLCFSSQGGRSLHELLPVAHKERNVDRVAERIRFARDRIGVPFLVENISYYWHPGRAEMSEAEFLAAVCSRADCGLLLDVNNVFVNSINFGFDVDTWLRTVPMDRVAQLHVAGHEWFEMDGADLAPKDPYAEGSLVIDTHGADAPPSVLALLEQVLDRVGPVPVTLERDTHIPDLDALLGEMSRIRDIWTRSKDRFRP